MLKFFGRFVIGGRSGKREQAWAVFLLWCIAFGWMASREATGIPLDGTQAILSAALWPVLINLAAAHGMEWFSSQTRFGGDASADYRGAVE